MRPSSGARRVNLRRRIHRSRVVVRVGMALRPLVPRMDPSLARVMRKMVRKLAPVRARPRPARVVRVSRVATPGQVAQSQQLALPKATLDEFSQAADMTTNKFEKLLKTSDELVQRSA